MNHWAGLHLKYQNEKIWEAENFAFNDVYEKHNRVYTQFRFKEIPSRVFLVSDYLILFAWSTFSCHVLLISTGQPFCTPTEWRPVFAPRWPQGVLETSRDSNRERIAPGSSSETEPR